MSLILDALRKIEQERKSRRPGTGDLRTDVLSYRGTRPAPASSRLIPATLCVLVVIGLAALFLLWRRDTPPPAATAGTASAPALPPPAVLPAVTNPPPSPPAPASAAPLAPAVQTAPPRVQKFVEQPRNEQPSTVRGKSGAGTTGGDLLVSGIAWQEERKLRRAVVNGSLVGEGAEILGARVVEIRENRVRFSRGGETFDVIYPGGGRE